MYHHLMIIKIVQVGKPMFQLCNDFNIKYMQYTRSLFELFAFPGPILFHISVPCEFCFCSQVAQVVIAISIDRGIHCGDQNGLVLMNSIQKCQNARLLTFT